jgi:hypothetical protein
MSGTVIIVGTLAPYTGEKGDAQIWCLNRAYRHQPNLDRLYLMDPLQHYFAVWGRGFVSEVNDLGVPVIVRFKLGSVIPRAENFTHGGLYGFLETTSVAAISDAIEEGFSRIVLHKMYLNGQSEEHLHHKSIVIEWIEKAIDAGIDVEVDPRSFVKPMERV